MEDLMLRPFARALLILCLLAGIAVSATAQTASAPAPVEVPVKGMVTMVDIGGESCTPCKMMEPILRELEETYRGKAAIIAINVGKDRDKSKLYGARIIPTQVFYDREGKETFRHEGFLDKKSIIEMLEKSGMGK
jgi:thioredoxin 1